MCDWYSNDFDDGRVKKEAANLMVQTQKHKHRHTQTHTQVHRHKHTQGRGRESISEKISEPPAYGFC